MDILNSRLTPRRLVYAGLGLIALQFVLVAVTGFAPPTFNAGWERSGYETGDQRLASRTPSVNLRAIESTLSPPPVLNWSDEPLSSLFNQFPLPARPAQTDNAAAEQPEVSPQEAPVPATQENDAVVTPRDDTQEEDTQLALLDNPPGADDIPDIEYGLSRIEVEPVYLRRLPRNLDELTADERKQRFISIMLPLMLRANEELEQRRGLVQKAVLDNDLERLKLWGRLYGYTPENGTVRDYERELLMRVAPIPVSIALAQSAIESGWGTSRFALQGNALMGQWAWNLDAGIRPREARYEDQVVRAFASLFDSVRAYMHNLNSHAAYGGFRETRAGIPSEPGARDITRLVNQLGGYSEKGGEYTDTLKNIIDTNDLLFYDRALLKSG